MRRRFLRPTIIRPTEAGAVWLVDQTQPVAAFLKTPDTPALVVDWTGHAAAQPRRPAPAYSWLDRSAVADGDDLVVCDRDSTLRLRADGAVSTADEPANPEPQSWVRWSWLEAEPEHVLRHPWPAGGLLWSGGAIRGEDKINRRAVLTGHDPTTGIEVVRVDLGLGQIADARAADGGLLVSVGRGRFIGPSKGVEIVAVSPDGRHRVVVPADSIDVTNRCVPLHRPGAAELAAQETAALLEFANLDAYWADKNGNVGPLADGLEAPEVRIDGVWPEAAVVIGLRYPKRPGVTLRRRVRLYDEFGQPHPMDNGAITLMEDLHTNYLPPLDEAVDGVLDI